MGMYTVYASAIYIKATATSDTELVTDAAIIIFIMELDEKLFELIKAHASSWMNRVFGADKRGQEEEKQDKEPDEEGSLALLKSKVEKLESQVEMLCNKLQNYEEQDTEKGEEDHSEEE